MYLVKNIMALHKKSLMINGLIADTKMQSRESKGNKGMNEMREVLDELMEVRAT